MVDFVLGAFFVGLIVRGWMRGLVREALDVATLILGAFIAFRFAGSIGSVVTAMSGISQEMARLAGGVVAFIGITIGSALVSAAIHRTIRKLPTLTTLNRGAGAALGAVYALVLATVALTLIAILPVPGGVDDGVQESAIAAALTDPDGHVQRGVEALAGDRVMQVVIALRRLVGDRSAVDGTGVALPPAEGKTEPNTDAAQLVFDALNRERVVAGLPPLAWSEELAVVAVARAGDAYRSGDLTARGPALETRLSSAGIRAATQGENLALAATPAGVHEAIVASAPHRDRLLEQAFRRVGVGVVSGPYGLMTVEVFAG
jgi:uncharacterized protein YkwD/uncharacterized membrane protein required for colicin V production